MLEFSLFFAQAATPDLSGSPAPAASPAAATSPAPVSTPAADLSPMAIPSAAATPDALPSAVAIPLPESAANTAVPATAVPKGLPIAQPKGFTPIQQGTLTLYVIFCISLIGCIMMQTSKSEGLSAQMIGGSSGQAYKGKRSGEDRLAAASNASAALFILMSIVMCFIFK
jgi:protein translocase SecG subunit